MRIAERRWTPTNDQLVRGLKDQYPQVRSGRGLLDELVAAFPQAHGAPRDLACIPDAWAIYPEDREVDIFEAEVTHPVSRNTMHELARLWFWLDAFNVRMNLYIVSRYGHVNQLDFLPEYLGILQLERKENGLA